MKQLYYIISAMVALVLLGGGCTKDTPDPVAVPSFKVSVKQAYVTSADLLIKSENVTDYAYIISETKEAPAAAIIFATGETGKVSDGDNTLTIEGFEGSSTYYVHFAYKIETGFGDIESVNLTTKDYTETMTIVKTTMDAVSVHVEMPAGKFYKIVLFDLFSYIQRQEQFGTTDYDYLDSVPNISTGSQTFTFKNGEPMFPDNDEDLYSIAPGSANRIMLGECDEEGNLLAEPDWESGGIIWTGIHEATNMNVKPALESKLKLNFHVDAVTSRSVQFSVNPDAGITGYTYIIDTKKLIDDYIDQIQLSGFLSVALTSSIPEEEPGVFRFNDLLKEGETYAIYVIGFEDFESLSPMTFEKYEFTQKASEKPAPKVEVKGIKAPDGKDTPSMIWFNVKAPNKDVARAKYLCNTAGQWESKLRNGETYESMLLAAASVTNELSTSVVAEINSAEGHNMSFNSEEMKSYRLAILGYNDEDVVAASWAEIKASEVPSETKVNSSLFSDLVGTWTATLTNNLTKKDVTFPVTIGDGPVDGPSTCPEEVYQLYSPMTREEVDALFADYKQYESKFKEKYRGLNRLVCTGFNNMTYKSPWDLFIYTKYSSYENSDLFFDYGVKWFLHIADGDVVTLPLDKNTLPAANWDGSAYYLMGVNASTSPATYIDTDFPVTVSADKQTITVNPIVFNNLNYYPSLYKNTNGYLFANITGASPLVLTKTTPAQAQASRYTQNVTPDYGSQYSMPAGNITVPYKMTKLRSYGPVKTVTMFSSEENVAARQAKVQKFIKNAK